MKRLRLALSMALMFGASVVNAPACGWGLHVGLSLPPLFSFGIGFGLGNGCGAYSCGYPYYRYPAYAYAAPVYAYSYNSIPAQAPASAAAPLPAPPAPEVSWTPSTPGAGKWVPDPEPYRYTPAETVVKQESPAPPVQTYKVFRTIEGVRVYSTYSSGL
jgi:hypothetical protein